MEKVMSHLRLRIPVYDREHDPMFHHITVLNPLEEHTTTQPNLRLPSATPPPLSTSETMIDSKPLLLNEPADGDGSTVKSEIITRDAAVKIETTTDFRFADVNQRLSQIESLKSEDPFGRAEMILANLDDSCAGFRPGFADIFTTFDPFVRYALDPRAVGFFAGLPPFALPVPFFYPTFRLDHTYSKRDAYDDCDAKRAGIAEKGAREKLQSDSRVRDKPSTVLGNPSTPLCPFCETNYQTSCCLFYSKYVSVFATSDGAVICECCDGEDDEDGQTDTDQKTDDGGDSLDGAAQVTKVPIVNPGWYGKGCRKRIKKKR